MGREREGRQVERGIVGLQGQGLVPWLACPPTHPPHCGAEGAGRAEHRTGAEPGSQYAAEQGGKTWRSPSSQSWALPVRSTRISVEGGASETEERNGEPRNAQNHPYSPLSPTLTKLIFLGTLT